MRTKHQEGCSCPCGEVERLNAELVQLLRWFVEDREDATETADNYRRAEKLLGYVSRLDDLTGKGNA